MNMLAFLPTTKEELAAKGRSSLDVIIVTADAYVDHPAFGAAVIGRYLECLGFSVGIIPQPDLNRLDDFKALGKPNLFFGVTAGNLDSMVALYTANRKIRSDDPYSENGVAGKKPYLPSIAYTNKIKEAFKGVPVILGGIEASLRRVTHYDYYHDKLRASILLDAKADLLVYGNGERPIKEIAERLRNGERIEAIKNVRGTAVLIKQSEKSAIGALTILPSHEEIVANLDCFNEMTRALAHAANPHANERLYQEAGTRGVLVNPPSFPLSEKELDAVYALPFMRDKHPRYTGDVPAMHTTKYSIASHRGCYGGCSFCALYFHQGKFIASRSVASLVTEARAIAKKAKRSVRISDVGGPSANMYGTYCASEEAQTKCERRSCLFPSPCVHLQTSQERYRVALKTIADEHAARAVYINSGVRFDLALLDEAFIEQLAREHIQGHLSVAPEHSDDRVLALLGKPPIRVYERFVKKFNAASEQAGKRQYALPYFIVGLPGETEETARALYDYFKKNNITVEQVQEFYPTPMSIATAMYVTGKSPITNEPVYSEKRLSVKRKWKNALLDS